MAVYRCDYSFFVGKFFLEFLKHDTKYIKNPIIFSSFIRFLLQFYHKLNFQIFKNESSLKQKNQVLIRAMMF